MLLSNLLFFFFVLVINFWIWLILFFWFSDFFVLVLNEIVFLILLYVFFFLFMYVEGNVLLIVCVVSFFLLLFKFNILRIFFWLICFLGFLIKFFFKVDCNCLFFFFLNCLFNVCIFLFVGFIKVFEGVSCLFLLVWLLFVLLIFE